jgi:hypothetical protein
VLILVSLGLLLVRILDNFNVNGRIFNAIELPTYDGPYIVLETLDREKNLVNGCYILDMLEQKSFKLGRGHDTDVRITDISVSRSHARIYLDEKRNKFILEDDGSKFGTLLFLRKSVPLCGKFSDLYIQVGRTLINLIGRKNIKID